MPLHPARPNEWPTRDRAAATLIQQPNGKPGACCHPSRSGSVPTETKTGDDWDGWIKLPVFRRRVSELAQTNSAVETAELVRSAVLAIPADTGSPSRLEINHQLENVGTHNLNQTFIGEPLQRIRETLERN